MAFPGECDDKTNEDNRKIAAGRVGSRSYAPVYVNVIDRDATKNTVTFSAKLNTGKMGTFTETWGDEQVMWAPCPSKLPSQATASKVGAPPAVDAKGDLMLSDSFIKTGDILSSTPKWPKSLAADDTFIPVPIRPTSIVITGVPLLTEATSEGSIDLLNPAFAVPGQTIVADGGTITIEVSASVGVPALGLNLDLIATSLSAAVEVITSEKSDPLKLVKAWKVVAAVHYGARARGEELPPAARELIGRVLPDLKS